MSSDSTAERAIHSFMRERTTFPLLWYVDYCQSTLFSRTLFNCHSTAEKKEDNEMQTFARIKQKIKNVYGLLNHLRTLNNFLFKH